MPLFPAAKNPDEPVSKETAGEWLVQAERLAKQPKLEGGLWHPYRRHYGTMLKGKVDDSDIARSGGWRSTASLRKSYIQADAEGQRKVLELVG